MITTTFGGRPAAHAAEHAKLNTIAREAVTRDSLLADMFMTTRRRGGRPNGTPAA
jgi:acetylornithine/succinyldiaminopimelate/putrescine aminotransferase